MERIRYQKIGQSEEFLRTKEYISNKYWLVFGYFRPPANLINEYHQFMFIVILSSAASFQLVCRIAVVERTWIIEAWIQRSQCPCVHILCPSMCPVRSKQSKFIQIIEAGGYFERRKPGREKVKHVTRIGISGLVLFAYPNTIDGRIAAALRPRSCWTYQRASSHLLGGLRWTYRELCAP